MANLCAIIANRGWYYTPHIIKDSENVSIDDRFRQKNYTMVDTLHFQKVVGGMYRAVNSGFGSGGTASIAAVKYAERQVLRRILMETTTRCSYASLRVKILR